MLGHLAYKSVPGNLFLETCPWKPIAANLAWNLSWERVLENLWNLSLGTLLGNLACKPALENSKTRGKGRKLAWQGHGHEIQR